MRRAAALAPATIACAAACAGGDAIHLAPPALSEQAKAVIIAWSDGRSELQLDARDAGADWVFTAKATDLVFLAYAATLSELGVPSAQPSCALLHPIAIHRARTTASGAATWETLATIPDAISAILVPDPSRCDRPACARFTLVTNRFLSTSDHVTTAIPLSPDSVLFSLGSSVYVVRGETLELERIALPPNAPSSGDGAIAPDGTIWLVTSGHAARGTLAGGFEDVTREIRSGVVRLALTSSGAYVVSTGDPSNGQKSALQRVDGATGRVELVAEWEDIHGDATEIGVVAKPDGDAYAIGPSPAGVVHVERGLVHVTDVSSIANTAIGLGPNGPLVGNAAGVVYAVGRGVDWQALDTLERGLKDVSVIIPYGAGWVAGGDRSLVQGLADDVLCPGVSLPGVARRMVPFRGGLLVLTTTELEEIAGNGLRIFYLTAAP